MRIVRARPLGKKVAVRRGAGGRGPEISRKPTNFKINAHFAETVQIPLFFHKIFCHFGPFPRNGFRVSFVVRLVEKKSRTATFFSSGRALSF